MQDRMVTFHRAAIGSHLAIPTHTGTGILATTVGIQAIIIRIATTIIRAITITPTVTAILTATGAITGIQTHTIAITGGIGDLTGSCINHIQKLPPALLLFSLIFLPLEVAG